MREQLLEGSVPIRAFRYDTGTWYGSYDKLTCSVFMRSYKRTAVISDMKIWGYELQVNATCSVGQ